MKLDFVPLLQVQRELYDIPLGWTRFKSYLEVMTGGTDDVILPLVAMKPSPTRPDGSPCLGSHPDATRCAPGRSGSARSRGRSSWATKTRPPSRWR